MTRRKGKGKGKSHGKGRKSESKSDGLYAPAIMPPRVNRSLKLISTGVITSGGASVVKRWNPNAAFTPETGGSSGATPGYADLAALYGYYRVVSYSYEFSVVNLETSTSVVAYVINSNNDPSTSINSNIVSNPRTQMKTLGPKGGLDKVVMKGHFSINTIVGSPTVKYDDLYSSVITADPADITWLGLGIQSIGGATLAAGVSYSLILFQNIIFYDYLLQIFSLVDRTEAPEYVLLRTKTTSHLRGAPAPTSKATHEKEIMDRQRADEMYTKLERKAVPLWVVAKRTGLGQPVFSQSY